jgi:hypothetical protein
VAQNDINRCNWFPDPIDIKASIELAKLRNTSIAALMQELGIKTPEYA